MSEHIPKLNVPAIMPSNSLPVTAASTPGGAAPRPATTPLRPSTSRATSVATERRETPVIAGTDPASEFRLRKKVLMSNPELLTLHRDLVMTGQITEAEFWDGREVCLLLHLPSSSADALHSISYFPRPPPSPRRKANLDNWSILAQRPLKVEKSRLESPLNWCTISLTNTLS